MSPGGSGRWGGIRNESQRPARCINNRRSGHQRGKLSWHNWSDPRDTSGDIISCSS
jgi:hypothetical protein